MRPGGSLIYHLWFASPRPASLAVYALFISGQGRLALPTSLWLLDPKGPVRESNAVVFLVALLRGTGFVQTHHACGALSYWLFQPRCLAEAASSVSVPPESSEPPPSHSLCGHGEITRRHFSLPAVLYVAVMRRPSTVRVEGTRGESSLAVVVRAFWILRTCQLFGERASSGHRPSTSSVFSSSSRKRPTRSPPRAGGSAPRSSGSRVMR